IRPKRRLRSAIAFKPCTLLNFHRALVQRKYRLLFSPTRPAKPGPKGPDYDLIRAVIDMKQRNPQWGCPRIAKQIALAFGISINKDVVRRILAAVLPSVCRRQRDLPGSPSSVTRKIAFTALICSDVNRWSCGRTGRRWLWISTVGSSLDSEFMLASSTDGYSVACSIERFDGNQFRNISVRIMIRCIDSINGKRT